MAGFFANLFRDSLLHHRKKNPIKSRIKGIVIVNITTKKIFNLKEEIADRSLSIVKSHYISKKVELLKYRT